MNVIGALAVIPDRGGDFAMLYRSTDAWLHGLPAYASPDTPTTNLNHPIVWLVMLPFIALPERAAFVVWTVLSLAVFGVAARVAARVAAVRAIDVLVIVLATTGASFELALRQLAFALLLPLMGAWWLERTGRVTAAGACIGLLCVLKPFYGLFALMFIWRREWRAAAACAATAACALLAGWALAGTGGYLAWIDNLRHVTWTWHVFNGSVWGVASRLFSPQQIAIAAAWTPLVISPGLTLVVSYVGVALIVVLLWRGLRGADADRRYALISLASLLLSPLGWVYYLPASFAPVTVTLSRRPGIALWIVLALAMCPYGVLVNRRYGLLATLTLGQTSFVVVFGLFLLVYGRGAKRDTIDTDDGHTEEAADKRRQ